MGKEKYQKEIEMLFKKSPVVSYKSIERIIHSKKSVQSYGKKLIHQLLAKGKIKRLAKGYYTTRDEASLIVFCFQPAYLGLQDAVSFHNIWEQETIPIIVTARKARQGIRKVLGNNASVRRINKKYLFGILHHHEGEVVFPYSDIEKTFIDMVYFREHMDKAVIKEFKKKIDRKKLNAYLKKYQKLFRNRVMNRIL